MAFLAPAVLVALAIPAAGAAAYLLVLAIAAAGSGHPALRAVAGEPEPLVALVVPAHDEALLVGRCVSSLLAQDWPASRMRVVVVADNCSDSTAEVAGRAGAEVWARRDELQLGKGHALRWAFDRLLEDSPAPDAVVVVDADSVAERGLVRHLVAAAGSAGVAQADYMALDTPGSTRTRLVSVAMRLFHRVRLGGRARLGLPAALVGNGMAFRADILRRHPWDAFSGVEDLENTLRLRMAGVRVAFAPGARVHGPVPTGATATVRQRQRWEGGRFHVMRLWLPRLTTAVLRGRVDLLDALVDLAVPPLSILTSVVAVGLLASSALALAHAVNWAGAIAWAAAAAILVAYVGVGFVAAGANRADVLALLAVPGFLALKMITYARLLRGFEPDRWDRTEREPPDGGSVTVGGVRVDGLTMAQVRARLRLALGSRRLHQVATVNMDFLARAQRYESVRSALNACYLNVPDGWPVVWLARLRGQPVPQRVAGADLVPLLLEDAQEAGAGVFLLGGEHGAAAAAATSMRQRYPGLIISGCLEPPRASLDDIDSDSIVQAVRASGADVLLVALGHPKQDLWISRHRAQLPVSVAVGVGCVFDLLAGRSRRAPRWMCRFGLEWLYRLVHEPRRLAGRYLTDFAWMAMIAVRGTRQPRSLGTERAG